MPGTLIILNPTAGGGRAGRLWPRLESRLRQALGPFELMRTSRIGAATEIAARSDGSHLVVACGGDGTIHEVANGILSRKEPTSLGILSIGTGGDLIKSLRIPSDLLGQIDVLSKGSEQAIDVGEIHYSTPVGMKRRLFLNIADAGLGADVLRRLATTRSVFGRRLAYLSASLEAYRHRQPAKMTVTLDGKKIWEQSTLIAVVANGRSFGGGMQIAPAADLRDGLFEIVLMQDLPPRWLPVVIPSLYLRQAHRLPQVKIFRGRKVTLEAEAPVFLDIDGELEGSLPCEFQILPDRLKVRIP